MTDRDKERLQELEQENWGLKRELKETEAMLENLDRLYTNAVNLLHDCKCVFQRLKTDENKVLKTCKKMIGLIEESDREE